MAELADAKDLKSFEGILVRVQVPLPAEEIAGWSNWKLVGLITRRLSVRIRPPPPERRRSSTG